jgi:uncharacterized membrane protein
MTAMRILDRRRWTVLALAVSLVLNAFLIGATATDVIHFGERFRGPPPAFRFELGWLKGRLPEEGFEQVKAALEANREIAKVHIDRLNALRDDLGKLVAVPEPDRAAVDAKLAEIRSELSAMQAENQRISTEALLALPPGMRAGLAAPDPHRP